ncbi:hypothetical protein I4U23_018437 [Adineta vaga]|nr:hypothetical protein I4U23_018437 [Adineta vaga]
MNDAKHQISTDVFFHSKNSSIICAFVFTDPAGYIQINRLDIEWKSTIYVEQSVSYSFEILQIPLNLLSCSFQSIRFAHTSPILAISLSTHILFVSLTTITFSKLTSVNCSFVTSPTHQQVLINDLVWSLDDQFLIGLTNRGALFFLNRFGSQLNLVTQGECITQGPSPFVIIHPLIGQDSEATNHLGLDAFMRSIVPFSNDDKTKQQTYSLTINTTKSVFYCSDGYRLARIMYSNNIRDRRFYDPLLYLYLTDLNQQHDQQSLFIHKTRSFDDLPKVVDRFDTESIRSGGAGGDLYISSKYGSLTSLPIDDLPQLSLDDIFSAYHLLFTSSERVQHDICACLERTTQKLLTSPDNQDILTSIQLSRCLTNLVLSSSFGSLTFLHLSCLTKFIPLFIHIFQQQTTVVNEPELLQLCILRIIEQWLQSVLYIPTRLNTFEICRRQKLNYINGEERDFQLCKGIKQLELLQGTNINLDEFLAPTLPNQRLNPQTIDSRYDRITLLRSWYILWSKMEKKFRHNKQNLPKYLITIRLFLQSVLHSYPSLYTIRLSTYGHPVDLNNLFPPTITPVDQLLNKKSYSTMNERRKQRRRVSNAIEQPSSARSSRRGKPPTEARKALVLHRVLYGLLEQYNIRDAICILNVALRRETSVASSCLPLDLFSANLFQYIDTRTHFGMPNHALRSVLRTLARFMARSMIINEKNKDQQELFIYSVDFACPLPNLFKTKYKTNEQLKYRMIHIDRNRLNIAIEQQKLSKFWQPLKVLELFILGQSPNEAVFFAKLVGDWRTALCLASVLPPHNGLYASPKTTNRSSRSYSPLNTITVDALLYTKLCEYLQIDNLKSLLKRSYKQEDILVFIQNLPSTLEQFLLCSTLLQVPLTEMLLKRLNAIMIYLFTLISIPISSKYYLPCPPIYSSILNTYDDDKYDITCKYETHVRLIYYRTIHMFIQILSASRIQLSCLKWYLDYLTMTNNRRKQTPNIDDSFHSLRMLLKSLRFHKLPNIPDRILVYFRDFCIMLFLLDTRDRLSLTLRNYIRQKTESILSSDKLAWQIISYATILLSFRCLISDEMNLLRIVLNLLFDLTPSEQLMRALATLIITRQDADNERENNAEIGYIIEKLKAKWMQINPTLIRMYEDYLEKTIVQDVQGDMVKHYLNDISDHQHPHQEPLFDFKPKWFETCVEYGEFMTMLIPLLLDTSSLTSIKKQELNNDHTKFDSTSIPLVQTMSAQLRELELPTSLDKRYLLKQTPLFIPPHEYVVFPVRILQNDPQQTMFQQPSTAVNHTTVGSFIQTPLTQPPPGVVSLEQQHRHSYQNLDANNNNIDTYTNGNPSMEWDGRSDDPSRSHVRQFDAPYDDAARHSIWMTGWANRGFSTTTDQTQTPGMRIPAAAQFLAATSLISDQQRYDMVVKQNSQQNKANHDQGDNDTDLTDVTKNEDEDGVGTQSDMFSSPRRRDLAFRKNSLDESMSLPNLSNDGGGDFGRNYDFRAPSRETIRDETPTYDFREFPTDIREPNNHPYIHQQETDPPSQISPPTSNGFQQQQQHHHPTRQSLTDRRYFDDSDPHLSSRMEQEEKNKYVALDSNRTATLIQSPNGYYPSSLDSRAYQTSHRDSENRRSPTRDPSSRQSPRRDRRNHRSPSRDPSSHRSTSHDPYQHYQPFPHLQPTSMYDQPQLYAPIQRNVSLRLPLLRLGGPTMTTAPMLTRVHLAPTAPSTAVYPPRALYVPTPPPRIPYPMLHLAPQLPPPVSLTPQATRIDQQKLVHVQNIMHQYAEHNRPRLQLLQMRPHPRTTTTTDLQIPMPAPNIVSTSSDTKIDTGIQAEMPRQDGFIIEPGLFQSLLRETTGVNFTSAEAHFSAARQIQQQALEARRRERSTMTDLPAHQVLYDLQYARGGTGDERKFVNVTDIAGTHADALLAQIERDQNEREQQARLRQQQQQQPQPPPIPMITNINEMPPAVYPIGFERQYTEMSQQQPYYPPLGFDRLNAQNSERRQNLFNNDDIQRQNELILERRRQREEEERQAERLAFGNIDGNRSPRKVTYELDENDVPLEYLIRQRRSAEPISDANSHIVDPISVRSITPRSPRKQTYSDRPISIKTTTPRDPFSSRKTVSHTTSHSSTTTPRKAASPTIADRHREARQRQQQVLSRLREQNALRFADDALHGEPVPSTRALDEFQLEALETSFTSTVRELSGPGGLINRTYDLDLMDDVDDIDNDYSNQFPSRPMSAATSNFNHNASHFSTSSSPLRRTSSASSTRSRPMTPMGKAIVQVKQKGPPPARSNMARKRPLSSPANLGHKRGSMNTSIKNSTQPRQKLVRTIRKASPPSHKPTTYNERVRSLNKPDAENRTTTTTTNKSDSMDPKALMRLYGTRRVPGLYVPYEKTDPRMTKTYAERMQELQQSTTTPQPHPRRQPQKQEEQELEQRPSSAPSSSLSLSDWEVDDRVKQLLADDQDSLPSRKLTRTITPLDNLDELDDDELNMEETTYSLTRVTEQTNDNTYGDDLRLLQYRRSSGLNTNTHGGTRISARSSAGGDMTARDESELSRNESSIASIIDWSAIDRDFPTGTQ